MGAPGSSFGCHWGGQRWDFHQLAAEADGPFLANAVAQDAQGRLLVAGAYGQGSLLVLRLTAAGQLDTAKRYVQDLGLDDLVVVAPDVGRVKLAEKSEFEEIVVTDTIPLRRGAPDNIRVLSPRSSAARTSSSERSR